MVSMVARQHGVNPNKLLHRRKLSRNGIFSAVNASEDMVPPSELSAALKQIRKLQRLFDKISSENARDGLLKRAHTVFALALSNVAV